MDKTGKHVIYLDDRGRPHDALVTADWNKSDRSVDNNPVNLVIVSDDPARHDEYGQQIWRPTSIAHITQGYSEIKANCWLTVDEYKQLVMGNVLEKLPQMEPQ